MLISVCLLVLLVETCKTGELSENQIDNFSGYQCNGQLLNSPNFTLTSPNFPRSSNFVETCRFLLTKTNRRTCKLELNFRYFSLGPRGCGDGYLEIDGKYFCGCNSGLRVRVDFEEETKVLNFKSSGTSSASESGFVIDLEQVECPANEVLWPQEGGIEKLDLIRQNTIAEPRVIRSFYVFEGRKELTDLDVVTSDGSSECSDRNTPNLINFPQEKRKEKLFFGKFFRTCLDLDYIKGYFRSPGYPFFYPRNVNLCYKFRKQPGYCSVEITMHDFLLEQSPYCKKDYFSVGSRRYCGKNLIGKTWSVDPGEDVRFVSDSFWSCRGFSATFRQVPCRETPSHGNACNETTKQRVSRLGLARDCVFTINKLSEDVCRLKLKFESLHIDCDAGNLTVGQDVFCGNLSGKEVSFDFKNVDYIKIVYRNSAINQSTVGDVAYTITGEQVENCAVPEPEPERLIEYSTVYRIKSKEKDLCRLVRRDERGGNAGNLCEFFLENLSVASCDRTDLNLSDVPYEVKTLNIQGKIETIHYTEINCDHL